MNPLFQTPDHLWWFRCPIQDDAIGPFGTEGAAHEAWVTQTSYQYVKSQLNIEPEIDISEER